MHWLAEHSELLGVEIDEAKFGMLKYNLGRHIVGQWVLALRKRSSRRVFLVPASDRTSETLLDFICQ